jgi:predicted DNA binding CopG/RHH family protein
MKKTTRSVTEKKAPAFDSPAFWSEFESRLERGEMQTIKNFAHARKVLATSAREQREKTSMVSIRVREHDLARFRARAERDGFPYQTMINALIRKYAHEEYA